MNIRHLILLTLVCNPVAARYVDMTKNSGLDFNHVNGNSGKFYMPEIIGSGAAFFDYDNDGDMDVYLVQSGDLFDDNNKKGQDKLFRNDTKTPNQPKFTDVTKQSQIISNGYGMGVAIGDLNNDGFEDIFVANYSENEIFMNNGDGTFKPLENAFPTTDKNWSVGASIVDYNNDGLLDIYVVNYVEFPLTKNIKKCRAFDSSLDYCSPQGYKHHPDYLYKNLGNGKFENIYSKAGLKNKPSAGLGVVAADFNQDSLLDFYVANDGEENHLWINKGNDEFQEAALSSGVAVNMNGEPEASMGVDAADYDNDGDVDLFMTHLKRQTNTLYVNNGKGWFFDLTMAKKLGSSSYSATGFGTAWFDYNNDGLLDLFSANGSVSKIKSEMKLNDSFPFKQSNQIWQNIGNGSYKETSSEQGENFNQKGVSRGLAVGDIDNDGDIDMLVTNNNGNPQLLVNKLDNKTNWIGFHLKNSTTKRSDIGAIAKLTIGDVSLTKRLKTDGSYSSSRDNRLHFGLNSSANKIKLKVNWSDGTETQYENLDTNKYHTLILKK